eukprot:1179209-Prorocentrum_minimum.AAC.5
MQKGVRAECRPVAGVGSLERCEFTGVWAPIGDLIGARQIKLIVGDNKRYAASWVVACSCVHERSPTVAGACPNFQTLVREWHPSRRLQEFLQITADRATIEYGINSKEVENLMASYSDLEHENPQLFDFSSEQDEPSTGIDPLTEAMAECAKFSESEIVGSSSGDDDNASSAGVSAGEGAGKQEDSAA